MIDLKPDPDRAAGASSVPKTPEKPGKTGLSMGLLHPSQPAVSVLAGYMRPAELAAELGITPRTLAKWRALRADPPSIMLGMTRYYRREAVAEWLRAHEVRRDG